MTVGYLLASSKKLIKKSFIQDSPWRISSILFNKYLYSAYYMLGTLLSFLANINPYNKTMRSVLLSFSYYREWKKKKRVANCSPRRNFAFEKYSKTRSLNTNVYRSIIHN